MERKFVAENRRSLERMRSLLSRFSDDDLTHMVNEYWSVAGVLGHVAFWDGRALIMAGRLARGEAFTPSDAEPDSVDWINDSYRPMVHAVAPRTMAELALSIAEETDAAVAALSPEALGRLDEDSPLNPLRASHRNEHLDEIEAIVDSAGGKRA